NYSSAEIRWFELGSTLGLPRFISAYGARVHDPAQFLPRPRQEWHWRTLIGSRALAAYDDVDGPSAANNRPWSRKYTARLLRRSDTSSSAYSCAGTRSVRLGGAESVG